MLMVIAIVLHHITYLSMLLSAISARTNVP